MTATIDKPKRHISAITADYKPFWQPLFDNMGLSNPTFGAKLCYMGKEFSTDGSRVPCLRFFPNELSSGNDYYTELFDWNQNKYDTLNRVLYRLRFNPNWQKETTRYIEILSEKLSTSTYAVRLSDLEVVNITDAKALYPELVRPAMSASASAGHLSLTAEDPFNEESMADMFSDKEDNHYSSMTIRDLYCMMQNVPMSNKKWLNELIEKGKQWQKK